MQRLPFTGDIAQAHNISEGMLEMAKIINKPIYFVLENHDYYGGITNVDRLRAEMRELTEKNLLLTLANITVTVSLIYSFLIYICEVY